MTITAVQASWSCRNGSIALALMTPAETETATVRT